ncbi:uncharacterized protein [Hetaerina americana]|uniref:uncharacterized protein n=1 Tax=Hetaerina americana TaxID=62018 RepID=UPI003A7F1BE3
MKFLLCLSIVAVVVLAAEEETTERPKTFRRLIPADVLRDFPGLCFASTRCATIEPGKSWELTPFCGRSTCIADKDSGRLLEMVEDCGPLPKANPKCKLSEKTNKTAPFPECCPTFDCEPGVKLEYPDLTSPAADGATDAAATAEAPKA